MQKLIKEFELKVNALKKIVRSELKNLNVESASMVDKDSLEIKIGELRECEELLRDLKEKDETLKVLLANYKEEK